MRNTDGAVAAFACMYRKCKLVLCMCTAKLNMKKYSVGRDDPGAPLYRFMLTMTNKKSRPL